MALAGRHSWASRLAAAGLASRAAAPPEVLEALLRAAANADEPTNELIPATTPFAGGGRWPPAGPRMAATPSMAASEHA